jgi:type IV secretory pathway VirJ component
MFALLGCGSAGAAADAAKAERLPHGRFDQVVVSRPAGTASSFVLLLSDSAGADEQAQHMAQLLAGHGALVAGVDTHALFAFLEKDGADCEFTDGDLENLSHFIQAYEHLPTYLPPLLVGTGSGAAFAYANLAQAPAGTFGGGLAIGLCPQLPLHKPLCPGTALRLQPNAGGAQLLPAASLAAPLTALIDSSGAACDAVAARAFAGAAGAGHTLDLPAAGAADAQILAAFDILAAANRPQGLPPAPAGLDGLPLVEVPAQPGVTDSDAFALLISGDGGWAGLDKEVAAALAAHGIPVAGMDSLRYFWTARTPEGTAADVDRIVRYYLAHWNKRRALLVGYSQGADVMPFVLNRLPAATRAQVALATVMGLSGQAVFEFHMGNWMGGTTGPSQPTLPEMQRAAGTPMLCIYGADETDSLCPRLDPAQVHLVALKGGHHFDGDYDRLAREILAAAGIAATGTAQAEPAATQDHHEDSNMFNLHSLHADHLPVGAILSLIAGILILVQPKLLNYVIAIYLILVGILGLVHW